MRTALSGTFSVSSFVTSRPSMPGMRTSMITTFGRRRSASATADSPSAASPITRMWGALESERRRPSRTTSWSSTIRQVISGVLTAGRRIVSPGLDGTGYARPVADWVTISALATAGGTLALAATTYASVRSANKAARTAERSLLAELRPLIVESSEQDPPQHVNFVDVPAITVPGGGAAVEVRKGFLYIVLSLRNVGPGIGVLHGGRMVAELRSGLDEHGDLDKFRMLTRDIYIPSSNLGFWQIAYRDAQREELDALLPGDSGGELYAEILYGDFEGGQRLVSRFRLLRVEDDRWTVSAVRHWQVDRDAPR